MTGNTGRVLAGWQAMLAFLVPRHLLTTFLYTKKIASGVGC